MWPQSSSFWHLYWHEYFGQTCCIYLQICITTNKDVFSFSSVILFWHVHTLINFVNRTNLVHSFLNMFIAFLYMLPATMCPSSGENTVPMRHLVICHSVWMTIRYAGRNHPTFQTVIHTDWQITRCRIGTVFSPDDWHIVARNM